MNEQLVVKNFGPIKDATVDFKRVTVFIGPTGGGKSTLAKLAAVFRELRLYTSGRNGIETSLRGYGIDFVSAPSFIDWQLKKLNIQLSNEKWGFSFQEEIKDEAFNLAKKTAELNQKAQALLNAQQNGTHDSVSHSQQMTAIKTELESLDIFFAQNAALGKPRYIPAERMLVSILDEAWPALVRNKIGLPPTLSFFAEGFLQARSEVKKLHTAIFDVGFEHINGRDFIRLPLVGLVALTKAASGIQSATPMLVLLEYLSRNTEQAQSFIIEEPELNLYPTAQQGLLNWLVEKCTKGENDLTITTHSPYLLAHFNLLLYAYQVAENHPDRADDVARIVPRESWINPKEFAAYHVEGQQENGVRSIVNPETGLISHNSLDSTASAETAEFEKLLDINAGMEIE